MTPLSNAFDTIGTVIVQRDGRERLAARSSQAIPQVVQMAFESAGSELSLRRIAGATGLSVDTVSSYLEACESAYLLFPHNTL